MLQHLHLRRWPVFRAVEREEAAAAGYQLREVLEALHVLRVGLQRDQPAAGRLLVVTAHTRCAPHTATLALNQLAEQQDARRALEARLQDQNKTHWKEMNDVQQAQARLRDRLATADLRLSVLVDAGALTAQGGDSGVREATSAGGVVHGAVRAQLDRAHAQRIVAITDEGDRGLIALQACQAYVREVTK
ncbi:lysis system i-spanin subunit Rz [Pseudomonas putida]|uniref:lysis system i-spanin subunit Rz n=1 Tax=Pseudomonas putida TaxID=303 RepID=UPI0024E17E88|nr:lysis system i-spanin subunit Rz [Pseudomonas putida]